MTALAPNAFPADLRLLTALRAFAALLVVLYHFAASTAPGSLLHATLFDRGYLGVDIFFVLSGFILAHVYLARCQSGLFAAGDFLWNRFARLYPMHLLMLAAVALNGWLAMQHGKPLSVYGPSMGLDPATGTGSAWNLATNLALVHAWGTNNGHYFNAVSWSISAETFAYLMFPAIAAACLAFGSRAWVRLAAALAFYAACEAIAELTLVSGLSDLSWRFGILRILPEFSLGVAFYAFGTAHPMPGKGLRWMTPAAAVLVLAMLQLGAPVALMPPLFGVLILLLANCERKGIVPPAALLNPLVYLGEISYSTYMIHLPLGVAYFNLVARLLHYGPQALPVWQVAAGLVLVLLASALTFHGVEQPGRALLRSTRKALARPSAPVAVAR